MGKRIPSLFTAVLLISAAFLPPTPARAGPGSAASPASLYLPFIHRPADVHLLPSDFSYVSSVSGDLHILGEVYNGLPYPVSYIRVWVGLYDRQGRALTVGNPYAGVLVEDLAPGARGCFDLVILDPPTTWYSYKFLSLAYDGGHTLPGMAVVYSSATYDRGEYRITGLVRNDEGRRVECVKPVGTLYNAAGRVVGCTEGYVDEYHLSPGATGSFGLEYYGRDFSDVAAYSIQVHGYPQE